MVGTSRTAVLCLLVALLGSPASHAATPQVPGQISYQGALLDDQGQPQAGPVDLSLRLYDALSGGTLLYLQIFTGTPLTDGVFHVSLGPTGAATDLPTDPLTTSLTDALAGDLLATGQDRFLEVTVGTEGPLTRTQILSVPYAERARSAESADTATQAIDVQNVSGLPSTTFSEIYEHTNLDNSGPPNTDPQEGLTDTDGDGIANFVDADNDNDGMSDGAEQIQGSDINLITPRIDLLTPTTADGFLTTTVQVQGENFEPGLTVSFGSQNPVPSNLTSTSFDVLVGPQPEGTVNVIVTRTNGEFDATTFGFFFLQPNLTSVDPDSGFSGAGTTVTVNGSSFDSNIDVVFGSQTPTPTNITPTAFDVVVGPQPTGFVDVTVNHPNGNSGTLVDAFEFVPGAFAIDAVPSTQLSLGLAAVRQVALGGRGEYGIDTDGDAIPETTFALATEGSGAGTNQGQLAVAFDPSGTLVGVRCRDIGTGCVLEYLTDSNADFDLEPETGVAIETLDQGPVTRLLQPSIAFDGLGRPVIGYSARGSNDGNLISAVAHDRDGDGQFSGVGERGVIATVIASTNAAEAAVDGSDRVAYVFYNGNFEVRAAYDTNDDGDFDDAGELVAAATTGGPLTCLGADFAPDGDLAIVFAEAATAPRFLRDGNADGDFADAGENVAVGTLAVEGCDIEGGSSLGLAHDAGGITLLVDRNDDGDFDDVGESTLLDAAPAAHLHLELDFDSTGLGIVATENAIFLEP